MQNLHIIIMDSKFFEDIIALLEHESFSSAAKQRNISQSAFSRRIQTFEQWCGFDVVDRSKQPISIHPAIKDHALEIKKLIHKNEDLRQSIRSQFQKNQHLVITTQHSLAISHLPRLLKQNIQLNTQEKENKKFGNRYRIRTLNRQEAIARFLMNQADVLLIFATPNENLDMLNKFPNRIIDTDTLIAVSSPTINVDQNFSKIPYLGYPEESYFHQVLQQNISREIFFEIQQRITYESAVTENLRHMCLLENGFTYLPNGLIKNDLANSRLINISHELGMAQLNVLIFTKKQEVLNTLAIDLEN